MAKQFWPNGATEYTEELKDDDYVGAYETSSLVPGNKQRKIPLLKLRKWIASFNKEVSASWFGLGSSPDDSVLFEALCQNKNVLLDVDITIKNVEISTDNLTIRSLPNVTLNLDMVRFTGNNVKLISTKVVVADASAIDLAYTANGRCLGGFVFVGSDCLVDSCNITRSLYEYSASYQSSRLIYIGMDVSIGDFVSQAESPTGHNNEVRNSYFANSQDGIDLGGRHTKVINSRFDNISSSIRFNASSRDVLAHNNIIVGNIDNYYSGADGILCSRTVIGCTITNNEITNCGEHGVYFQGQEARISNNKVSSNFHNGLKFGSYDDFSYVYPGETLDTWVPGAVGTPGFQGVDGADGFGMKDVIIVNNQLSDNGIAGAAFAYGIYVQPSAKNFIISNNELYNNHLYFVYFNSGGRLEDHIDITVVNNHIYGEDLDSVAAFIELGCHKNAQIKNNKVDGKIFTYAPNSTIEPRLSDRQIDSVIEGNDCEFINPARSSRLRILDNRFKYITSPGTNNQTQLKDNTIYEAIPFDPDGIIKMVDNYIEIITNDALFTGADYRLPKIVTGNHFVGNLYNGSYFIGASFSVDDPDYALFNDNKIECTNSNRPLYIEGTYCTIDGNVILGKTTADVALDCFGDNMVISNNICVYGIIWLRNDSANIVTSNKVSSVTDIGTTNIVANNG